MNLAFTDTNNKIAELFDDCIRITRGVYRIGHSYSRSIPYSAIKSVTFQNPSFLKLGGFSLITTTSGKTYIDGGELDTLDDETTFCFIKSSLQDAQIFVSEIKKRMISAKEPNDILAEFWGTTYKDGAKTVTVTPKGVIYSKENVTLPYSEIYKLDGYSDGCEFKVIIIKKGLDEKIRYQEYKKQHRISITDRDFCLSAISNTYWLECFYKTLIIILENKSKIMVSNLAGSDKPLDSMDGYEFERYCADLLRKNGFANIDITPKSGDQGVDILAQKDGIKYAFQCKHFTGPVGNKAVQEVNAGKMFYNCHVGVVLTDSDFSASAIQLAEATGVLLWGAEKMKQLLASTLIQYLNSKK